MAQTSTYRFILEPYKTPASRTRCPSCGKPREFSRYIDRHTGEYLPEHVGRCNREVNCGYHYAPSQFFKENPDERKVPMKIRIESSTPPPVDYLNLELILQSVNHKNNFTKFLESRFGTAITDDLIENYLIGTSNKPWPGATIFWQVDKEYNLRAGKVMLYNEETGKRVKEPFNHITWVHKILNLRDFNYLQCFFGEHLLSDFPDHPIAIVESEKTAIIARRFYPEFVWIATGGSSGCKWTEYSVYKVLEGRRVVFFPDSGCYSKWRERVKLIASRIKGSFEVSDWMEKHFAQEPNTDMVDILLNNK